VIRNYTKNTLIRQNPTTPWACFTLGDFPRNGGILAIFAIFEKFERNILT
jgi:hypothetical protein